MVGTAMVMEKSANILRQEDMESFAFQDKCNKCNIRSILWNFVNPFIFWEIAYSQAVSYFRLLQKVFFCFLADVKLPGNNQGVSNSEYK